MSLTKRQRNIDLKFTLATGDFGGGDTLELTGLRCSADIVYQGNSMAELDLTVYGMTLDQMNKLTILNVLFYTDSRPNTITVLAGDDKSKSVAFTGGIVQAMADIKGQPDATFRVTARAGYFDQVKPIKPTSFNGSVDVVTVLQGIAGKMTPPRTLEASGVQTVLESPYLPGTAGDQIKAICRAARLTYFDDGKTLAVYPEGKSRDGVVEISADTGMVSYPSFSQNAITVSTLFDPSIAFGQKANVKSDLKQATGVFVINQVTHNLDADTPGGSWFTHIALVIQGQEAPVPNG